MALAYMTGILPIKKYGSHSALNMFDEFSMTNPGPLASCAGFTDAEVLKLCEIYSMDYDKNVIGMMVIALKLQCIFIVRVLL